MTKKKIPDVIDEIFLKHPREAGEHYFEHLFYTVKVATYLLISACCAILHGLFPKILTTTTSDRVIALAEKMLERRRKGHAHPKAS